ncbi:hypothetical protein HK104_000015 [Borealophlyctis nickersoniae]|nr:hypothetical protein HK104_000015 [Borealophlyctis nickersoniae]
MFFLVGSSSRFTSTSLIPDDLLDDYDSEEDEDFVPPDFSSNDEISTSDDESDAEETSKSAEKKSKSKTGRVVKDVKEKEAVDPCATESQMPDSMGIKTPPASPTIPVVNGVGGEYDDETRSLTTITEPASPRFEDDHDFMDILPAFPRAPAPQNVAQMPSTKARTPRKQSKASQSTTKAKPKNKRKPKRSHSDDESVNVVSPPKKRQKQAPKNQKKTRKRVLSEESADSDDVASSSPKKKQKKSGKAASPVPRRASTPTSTPSASSLASRPKRESAIAAATFMKFVEEDELADDEDESEDEDFVPKDVDDNDDISEGEYGSEDGDEESAEESNHGTEDGVFDEGLGDAKVDVGSDGFIMGEEVGRAQRHPRSANMEIVPIFSNEFNQLVEDRHKRLNASRSTFTTLDSRTTALRASYEEVKRDLASRRRVTKTRMEELDVVRSRLRAAQSAIASVFAKVLERDETLRVQATAAPAADVVKPPVPDNAEDAAVNLQTGGVEQKKDFAIGVVSADASIAEEGRQLVPLDGGSGIEVEKMDKAHPPAVSVNAENEKGNGVYAVVAVLPTGPQTVPFPAQLPLPQPAQNGTPTADSQPSIIPSQHQPIPEAEPTSQPYSTHQHAAPQTPSSRRPLQFHEMAYFVSAVTQRRQQGLLGYM